MWLWIRERCWIRQVILAATVALVALVIVLVNVGPIEVGQGTALAYSPSASCSGGTLFKNSLTVSSSGSSVSYEATLSGAEYWRNGPGTGQLRRARSWLPDVVVHQKPITWSGGNTRFGGTVSYSQMGVRSGQTITLYGQGIVSRWPDLGTCRLTITLK